MEGEVRRSIPTTSNLDSCKDDRSDLEERVTA
jgi:hypothetical protein